MRVFLIVVAVLGVAFYVALIWGGSEHGGKWTSGEVHQKMSESSWGSVFNAIGDRFAPKLELAQKRFDVDAIRSPMVGIDVPRSSQSMRIAKFALIAGDAIEIQYQSSTLCVSRTGQPWPPDCEEDKKNSSWSKDEGSLVIRGEGGRLTFKVLHGPASAELR